MIKLIHVLSFLVFMSGLLFLTIGWRRFSIHHLRRLAQWLSVSLLLSVIFGATLVHQKGYFFTTPWIQAALLLCLILFLLLAMIFLFLKKNKLPWLVDGMLLATIAISVVIVHDAVTKTTRLFG